jgi:hypothetical protein
VNGVDLTDKTKNLYCPIQMDMNSRKKSKLLRQTGLDFLNTNGPENENCAGLPAGGNAHSVQEE